MNYSTLEDENLIQLIVQQRTEALGELYDRYNRLVFSIALYALGDRETAEEITQDVFTRVWQRAAVYSVQQAKVRTWLVSIARNRTIDELRRRQVRPVPVFLDEMLHTADGNLEDLVDGRVQGRRVRAALLELPEEQREVLLMAYFGGYSQSEISEVLDLPLGTVKTRVRLAMQKLRHHFYEEYILAL